MSCLKRDDVVGQFGENPAELPDLTAVCARYQDLKMAVWRSLLRHSADLVQNSSVQAIDATGFDRQGASRHYANRTNYRFKAVKTTALVDCGNSIILYIHCSMKQPQDTQIGPRVLGRNSERVEILAADKGYGSDGFREYLRFKDVRPVIKHRNFSSLDRAHDDRLDDEICGQRAVVESIFAAIKQRFGETLRARSWFGQFRELVLKAAVFDVTSVLGHWNE